MTPGRRRRRLVTLGLLAIVTGLALFLRLWRCESSLPGLQVDEASNAWNAWCLLNTGRDEWGQRWPLLYSRAFDDYRSPLYVYALLPFQAIGGMNVCTSRLPAAFGGALTVVLVYWIGRRMFGAVAGLAAAAIVAICPWHLQHTRWGHEACISPLLFAMTFYALLWAGAPLADRMRRPRVRRALLAGLVTAVACYGYAALRMVIPASVLLATIVVIPWRGGPPALGLKRRRLLSATVAWGGGLAVLVAPLLYQHLTDPRMNTRAREMSLWDPDASPAANLGRILMRYPPHFGIEFLFSRGGDLLVYSPPQGYGSFNWYVLPLMGAGLAAAVLGFRRSRSARVLLALLAAYPAGDLLFAAKGVHALRAFAGVVPLALLAGFGAAAVNRWLGARGRALHLAVTGAFVVFAIASTARFLSIFYGPFNDDIEKLVDRQVDFQQAYRWLAPRLAETDRVYVTTLGAQFPYCNALVYLNYDPAAWLKEPRLYVSVLPPLIDRVMCVGFGKLRVAYNAPATIQELAQLKQDGSRQRVILILRPDQQAIAAEAGIKTPAHTIMLAGRPTLVIYDMEL